MTNDEAFAVLDGLPSLPADMSQAGASLWAAGTILREGVRRGWDLDATRYFLFVLAINATAPDGTDRLDEVQVRSDFERALASIEKSKAPSH